MTDTNATKTETKPKGPCIGIDLGTTYSCVGYFNPTSNSVEIIANEQGQRTTPSYVAFTSGGERLVGESAKNQASMNPKNTVYDVKRIIGRRFTDSVVQQEIKNMSYKIVQNGENPSIQVEHEGETKDYAPEQISAMVLEYMKNVAEKYLGEPVENAVVTVPAYFNDQQRQATKDAGAICKLNILRVINEPTAAAICYGLNTSETEEKRVLIFDCGGGTQDVSLLEVDGGVIQVIATSGDSHLGGEDFDKRMVDYCVKEFKTKHKHDLSGEDRALRRLKTACERAKRTLSSSTSATIEIDALFEGIDFNLSFTRARFENICSDLFQKCMTPVEQVLKDAQLSKGDVDEIVLVGGSTRVPKIQEMLQAYFNGKKLNNSVNPDEAVAYGAAVQANILSGNTTSKTEGLVLLDVCSLSLGIETSGQLMTPMIPRNSTIPTKKSQTFSTYTDNQTAVTLKILEGERKLSKDCNLLGEFMLSGIPPGPRGAPQIEVTYDLDENGILKITALEKGSGKTENLEVDSKKSQLSSDDIERMVREAEEFKEEDENKALLIEKRNSVETYAFQLKETTKDSAKLSDEEKAEVAALADKLTLWLAENENATSEELDARKEETVTESRPYMMKVHESDGTANPPPDMTDVDPSSDVNSGGGGGGGGDDGPTVEEVD